MKIDKWITVASDEYEKEPHIAEGLAFVIARHAPPVERLVEALQAARKEVADGHPAFAENVIDEALKLYDEWVARGVTK